MRFDSIENEDGNITRNGGKNMIGQYTEQEFFEMFDRQGFGKSINLTNGLAYITKGKTTNYYKREADGSWTNYNCTSRYF